MFSSRYSDIITKWKGRGKLFLGMEKGIAQEAAVRLEDGMKGCQI